MISRGDENLKKTFIANVNVYRFSNLIKSDRNFRTNCCLVKFKTNQVRNYYYMTYNIRYLAIYIGSLKYCNLRYILSYKH